MHILIPKSLAAYITVEMHHDETDVLSSVRHDCSKMEHKIGYKLSCPYFIYCTLTLMGVRGNGISYIYIQLATALVDVLEKVCACVLALWEVCVWLPTELGRTEST